MPMRKSYGKQVLALVVLTMLALRFVPSTLAQGTCATYKTFV